MEYFRIKEVLSLSWEKFKGHFLFLWITLGIVVGLSSFISAVEKALEERLVLHFMVLLASLFFSVITQIGLTRLYLDLIDSNTEGKVSVLFSQHGLFFRYLGASLLFGLMVLFGCLFFIVPGIYLALKYQFFSELIVDKQLGILESLRKSGEMTEGIKWQLFGLVLALIGVNFLGALALGIGLLVTVPVTAVAHVMVYRKLSLRLGQNVPETSDAGVPVGPNTPTVPLQ